jgi:hypothetical protein
MHRKVNLLPREVYGISGSKGHGKDTFARLVLEAIERHGESRRKVERPRRGQPKKTFTVAPWAGALKRIAGRVFGLTHEQMHDPSLKEAPLKAPIQMDMFVQAMISETGLNIQPAKLIAHSPRELMQYLGTEYVRKAQDDYWVQRLLADIREERRVLVPDTRFINEAKAIWSVGGKIIKVVRIDAPENKDGHASETESSGIKPDLLLGVRTGDLSLPKRVAYLIACGKFDAACRYDYRLATQAMEAYVSGTSAEESARLLGQNHKHPYVLYNLLDYYGVPRRKQVKGRVEHKVIDGVVSKWCSACSGWKTLGDFNDNSKSWDGLAGLCRGCASEANKNRYQKYGKAAGLTALFKKCREGASARGLTFNLSLKDVHEMWEAQNGCCWYIGTKMTMEVGDPNKVSIDRLDSSKGYTRENTALCTKRINLMKRDMSVRDFMDIIQQLHDHAPYVTRKLEKRESSEPKALRTFL